MVRSILSFGIATALATLSAVSATTVSVMELGKGGVIHSIEASSPTTSSNGVMSFWKSVHDADTSGKNRELRTTQIPGMSVVPDLFSRANGGVVIGLAGEIDFEAMPTVASMSEVSKGQLHIRGNNGRKLMKGLQAPRVEAGEFDAAITSKAKASVSEKGNKLDSIFVSVENKDAAKDVDAALARMLKSLAEDAEKAGSTIIVHLVVDSDDMDNSITGRRRLSEENTNQGSRNLENENDDNGGSSYEIPGYYDENNNFITNYKTIFQIQYYNVCLWTAIGLFVVLVSANVMTMNMPLMPDTLLFGESAKMVAE